jgi:hypothetical protein
MQHGSTAVRTASWSALALVLAAPVVALSATPPDVLASQRVMAPDPLANDRFGATVAIDGDTAAIGNERDVHANSPLELGWDSGKVYAYSRINGAWTQTATILPPANIGSGRSFGSHIAISGDRMAISASIGAPVFAPDAPPDPGGLVFIYRREGNNWVQEATLRDPSFPAGGDPSNYHASYGFSLALNGNTLAVGAVSNIHVYTRSGTTWTLQQTLPLHPQDIEQDVGNSVALSGDILVTRTPESVFAPPDGGVSSVDIVDIWRRSGTVWTREMSTMASQGGLWGRYLAVLGFQVLVSNESVEGDTSDTTPRGIEVWTKTDDAWTKKILLAPPPGSQLRGFLTARDGHAFSRMVNADGSANGIEYNGSGSYWSLGTPLPSVNMSTDVEHECVDGIAESASTFLVGFCQDSAAAMEAGAADFTKVLLPPIVKPVTGDNYLNRADAANGVSVTGTADAGAKVSVGLGGLSKSATASSAGAWSVSFTGAEITSLADGKYILSATQRDASSHVSQTQTVRVRKDVIAPAAPSIDPVTGDDVVTASERDPLVITGHTSANIPVDLTVDTLQNTIQSDNTGRWTLSISTRHSSLLPKGNITVKATIRDTAGNVASATRVFKNQ